MGFFTQPALMVAFGGALGSLARYYLAPAVRLLVGPGEFPWPILLVNVLGSAILGIVAGCLTDRSAPAYLCLAVGVCGGFTTFSTFSLELVELLRSGSPGQAILYASASVLLGVGSFAGCFALVQPRSLN
jgi:fluoride exporter